MEAYIEIFKETTLDRIIVGATSAMAAIMAVLGQATGIPTESPWTAWAGLPFAAAAAAFLTWSLVQLTQIMFSSYKAASTETITVLRQQVVDLRTTQQETLVAVLSKATAAMQGDSEANTKLCKAWEEMHEDLHALLLVVHANPCLLYRTHNELDLEAVELIRRRHARVSDDERANTKDDEHAGA